MKSRFEFSSHYSGLELEEIGATWEELMLLVAVRNDPLIGRDTGSPVDQCLTDAEVIEELRMLEARTPSEATKLLYEHTLPV
jgi:hypothetical protein